MSDLSTPPKGLSGSLSGFVKGFRIRAGIAELGSARSVLDLGCGLCELIASLPPGIDYAGVERDQWMYDRACALFPRHRFHRGDIEEPSFDLEERVDAILLLAVWEHLHDPAALLTKARRWINDGGRFIATTPAPAAHQVLELGSKLGLLSRHADEEHEKLWSFTEIEEIARRTGWRMIRRKRFLLGANQLFVLEPIPMSSRA
ncbi:MAG TPA: class I SAM-dependent methyltransferase [Thermoanaerobaculia bacterium]|jgi:SAM-dependent methyltransferase